MNSPSWRIDRNPLFVKSVHNRLRARPTIIWSLIALSVSLFIFMVSYVAPTRRQVLDPHEAAGSCLLSLLIVQGIMLAGLRVSA